MKIYYNEIDPYAAQWLRNLIDAGHIAPGIVDERSIENVAPNELARYAQCHFFAGIGIWSLALRSAGWTDDKPVWTGSCPCQPFSSAGKGAGFADERHLWPAFHHLIEQCKPPTVFGEQVASKATEPWVDLVQADVEALGYAFGCVPFPSASLGAPHIRDRAYWVADTHGEGRRNGRQPIGSDDVVIGATPTERGIGRQGAEGLCAVSAPAATNGFWRTADWLSCRDGKWRAVEPGTFPLVDGNSRGMGRVRADKERIAAIPHRKDQGHRSGRLKGYGNAINAQAAQAFIEAFMDRAL